MTSRLCQGLALGGDQRRRDVCRRAYPAERTRLHHELHRRPRPRSASSSPWFVIGLCRLYIDAKMFSDGLADSIVVSVLVLLVFSVYIRLRLSESPIFMRMKEEGKGSKAPLTDSFLRYPNNKYVLLALLGAPPARAWWLVHRTVLRPVLPADHAQAGLHLGLHADRTLPDHRNAVLHRVRLVVGPDRPPLKIILAGRGSPRSPTSRCSRD